MCLRTTLAVFNTITCLTPFQLKPLEMSAVLKHETKRHNGHVTSQLQLGKTKTQHYIQYLYEVICQNRRVHHRHSIIPRGNSVSYGIMAALAVADTKTITAAATTFLKTNSVPPYPIMPTTGNHISRAIIVDFFVWHFPFRLKLRGWTTLTGE